MYIITGCSSGLGFEITKILLKEGFEVIGISRKIGKASQLNKYKKFNFISIDLSDTQSFDELNTYLKSSKRSSIKLILNAAKFHFEYPGNESIEYAQKIFNVNYFSALGLIKLISLEKLRRVIFINSIAGLESQDGQAQYSASKHSLQAYSEILAKKSIGMDFDVMSINPGGINTELWNNSDIVDHKDLQRFLDPKILASLICNFAALPKNTYIKNFAILPENDI